MLIHVYYNSLQLPTKHTLMLAREDGDTVTKVKIGVLTKVLTIEGDFKGGNREYHMGLTRKFSPGDVVEINERFYLIRLDGMLSPLGFLDSPVFKEEFNAS